MATRIAFLGPAGTFSDDALRAAVGGQPYDPLPQPTVYDALQAVADGDADRALVPFDNSIEGTVRATLDALAFDVRGVAIVGEHDHPVHHALIAAERIELGEVEAVLSHPQPLAQCARFLRSELPRAIPRAAASTAEAVREVVEAGKPWAALGTAIAAEIYGGVVLRENVEDEPGNVTRFVWIAPEGVRPAGDGPWRTTFFFSELGADHPGALVEALTEFSSREINLTRIESRPLRRGLGRYLFFIDADGRVDDPPLADALDALRGKAEEVRVLGSYPTASTGIP
ncbi:MAG TPA: prephenate dehydratase [Solirubrobacterales bacterium]|jgi:prephenate dehydratase